jgi:hypothetical protein
VRSRRRGRGQRLEIGDVVLIGLPEESEVEATVIREIDRTETAVRTSYE